MTEDRDWRHTRTTALLAVLERACAKAGELTAMRIHELVEQAQELHPLKDAWNYRDFVLRKKELFKVIKNSGIEYVSPLTRWLGEPGSEADPEGILPTHEITEIPVIGPDPEQFILKTMPPYVEVYHELSLVEAHLNSGTPLLEEGPKGIGKTLNLAYFAFKRQIPNLQFDCSRETKRRDLIGRFTVIGDQVMFILGALPSAIELANAKGEALLSLEELTSLDPDIQKILNQLLDHRKHVFVPELNRIFKLKPGARLLIAATANPSFYGGVFELNEDLKSRFSILKVGYPPEGKEREIIQLRGNISEELMDMIQVFTRDTRAGVKSGDCHYAVSPRDIHQFIDNLRSYEKVFEEALAMKMALTTSFLGKYDDENENEFIKARIFDAFAVRV